MRHSIVRDVFVVHEHPTSAKSWAEPEIQRLLKLEGVNKYNFDMCQYNLRIDGELVCKPTSIMTNSEVIGNHLAKHCAGDHLHIPLKGGIRARTAATYTLEFCQSLVEGYKLHLRKHGTLKSGKRQGSFYMQGIQWTRA